MVLARRARVGGAGRRARAWLESGVAHSADGRPRAHLRLCWSAACAQLVRRVVLVSAWRPPAPRVAVLPRPGRVGAVGGTTALAVARRGPGGPRSRARAISLRLRYRLSPDRSRLIGMTPRSPTGQRQSDNRHTSAAFRSNDNIEHSQVAGCRGCAERSCAAEFRFSTPDLALTSSKTIQQGGWQQSPGR